METPRIQYAKTSDGVNIAYWTIGQGTPLVYLPHPVWGMVYSSWEVPQVREWYEHVARSLTLVRYDARGTGESDRTAPDHSLAGQTRDLDAVMEALGIKKCALIAVAFSSMAAISYANRESRLWTNASRRPAATIPGAPFGATVILASRIAAKGGWRRDTRRGYSAGVVLRQRVPIFDRGEFVAKGIEDPVRVYEVKWRE